MDQRFRSAHEEARLASALYPMGGLTEALLQGAARYGFDEAGDCTANDVKALPGFLSWGKTLRFLRDQLIPLGWSAGRHPDLETVISPDRTFRVASASGNSATGDPDRMPSTHVDKGPLSGLAVEDNRQISFPTIHPQFGHRPGPEIQTWYLLQYAAVDEHRQGEIRVELSLPKHFSGSRPGVTNPKRGVLDDWKPRLILGAILIDDKSQGGHQEQEDEIDIHIERRRG